MAHRRQTREIKSLPESWLKDLTLGFEKLKARARALVEHPFHIVKNLFKHRKVRYPRPQEKDGATAHPLCSGQLGHRQEASAECPISTLGELNQPNAHKNTCGQHIQATPNSDRNGKNLIPAGVPP